MYFPRLRTPFSQLPAAAPSSRPVWASLPPSTWSLEVAALHRSAGPRRAVIFTALVWGYHGNMIWNMGGILMEYEWDLIGVLLGLMRFYWEYNGI